MNMRIFAAALAAALLAAPLSALTTAVQAQTAQAKKAVEKTKSKKPPTPGQLAARKRMKQCGAEWRAAKTAGKIKKGMTWPKYWSTCNKRLRAAGQ